MASKTSLKAIDGHKLSVTRSNAESPIGNIIILHAVFGVTNHLAELCDRFVAENISAAVPWLFDRLDDEVVHPYTPEGTLAGSESYSRLSEKSIITDIETCLEDMRKTGPVALAGFCTGGTWAWVGANTLNFDAAIIYYGSQLADYLDRKPKCPVEMHYGDTDFVVPMDVIATIRKERPEPTYYIYPGSNHAFFNPDQKFYQELEANLVWNRSLKFLKRVFTDK